MAAVEELEALCVSKDWARVTRALAAVHQYDRDDALAVFARHGTPADLAPHLAAMIRAEEDLVSVAFVIERLDPPIDDDTVRMLLLHPSRWEAQSAPWAFRTALKRFPEEALARFDGEEERCIQGALAFFDTGGRLDPAQSARLRALVPAWPPRRADRVVGLLLLHLGDRVALQFLEERFQLESYRVPFVPALAAVRHYDATMALIGAAWEPDVGETVRSALAQIGEAIPAEPAPVTRLAIFCSRCGLPALDLDSGRAVGADAATSTVSESNLIRTRNLIMRKRRPLAERYVGACYETKTSRCQRCERFFCRACCTYSTRENGGLDIGMWGVETMRRCPEGHEEAVEWATTAVYG